MIANSNCRGFTLIEVLIAITLLSVIVTIGFAVVRTGQRSWDAGEARFQAAEQRTMGIGFFQRYLANALPLQDTVPGKPPVFSFVGGPQAVRFVAFPPDPVAHGMLYTFQVQADGGVLRVAMQPYGKPLLIPLMQPEQVTLLEGVRNLRFSYFGADQDKPGRPYWRPSWRWPYFPDLIGIHIEDASGVTELQIAPRRGGDR